MTVEWWRGSGGNSYTERNQDVFPRVYMWDMILDALEPVSSILEVGANRGLNLDALSGLTDARLIGVEPNEEARKQIAFEALDGTAQSIPLPDNSVDMIFTCGVLIHVPPEDLEAAYSEIYRVASRYVVCIEYFSDKLEEIPYRGMRGLLWKRDFGEVWLDLFPLTLLDYGFFWKRDTGLDNLTWWAFEK